MKRQKKKKNDWNYTVTKNNLTVSETWARPVYVIVGCDYTERKKTNEQNRKTTQNTKENAG